MISYDFPMIVRFLWFPMIFLRPRDCKHPHSRCRGWLNGPRSAKMQVVSLWMGSVSHSHSHTIGSGNLVSEFYDFKTRLESFASVLYFKKANLPGKSLGVTNPMIEKYIICMKKANHPCEEIHHLFDEEKNRLVFLWFPMISYVFPMISYDFPMVCRMFSMISYGFSFVFPMISYVFPMFVLA